MPRKPHLYHFIYKTVNIVNNKFYVGMHSTSDLNDGYIGSGKYLWNSVKKYGKENFKIEILEWYSDRNSLKARERELINDEMLKNPLCMNLGIGGNGGLQSGSTHPNFGKTHQNWKWSESSREKQRWLWKNDPEWRAKASENIRNGKLGRKRPDIKGSNFTFEGKHHSNDTKKKISEFQKTRIISEKELINRSIAAKKRTGAKSSMYGKIWVKKDGKNLAIVREELDNFIKLGWEKGKIHKLFQDKH